MMKKVVSAFLTLLIAICAGCNFNNSKLEDDNNTMSTTASENFNNTFTDQEKDTSEILKRGSDENYSNLITTTYSQNELIGKLGFFQVNNFNTSLEGLDKELQYPIQCLRTFDYSLAYCMYKLEEGGLLYIFFHGTSLKYADYIFIVKEPLTIKNFSSIQKGNSLTDVEAVDPGLKVMNSIYTQYLSSKTTLHMVNDGFMKITYESKDEDLKNYKVESVEFIPNGEVLRYDFNTKSDCRYEFLPQDYPS